MGRLATTFAQLRERGERALIPYFTAGDPSVSITKRLVIEAARRGADIVELGVPFSDPLADGPVIQRATQRALQAGVTLPRVLELARDLRSETAVPLVFLTYYNPVLAFGLKAFCVTAVECGVDEFLEVLGGRLFVYERTVHKPPLSTRGEADAVSDRQFCNSYSVRGRRETLANRGGMLPIIWTRLQFSTLLSPKGGAVWGFR